MEITLFTEIKYRAIISIRVEIWRKGRGKLSLPSMVAKRPLVSNFAKNLHSAKLETFYSAFGKSPSGANSTADSFKIAGNISRFLSLDLYGQAICSVITLNAAQTWKYNTCTGNAQILPFAPFPVELHQATFTYGRMNGRRNSNSNCNKFYIQAHLYSRQNSSRN